MQRELTARVIELLEIPAPNDQWQPLLLDVGCGSGLSGEVLDDAGLRWVGIDIAPAMLAVAQEEEVEGDLVLADIGGQQPFRDGLFEGVVSVSVIQWLCHAFEATQDPRSRIKTFFRWLYNVMAQGARAALQFYPAHQHQIDLISKAAREAGFLGGIVVDNPDSEKKRKLFLVLSVGSPLMTAAGPILAGSEEAPVPSALAMQLASRSTPGADAKMSRNQKGKRATMSVRERILDKKSKQRAKGLEVRKDTKYTGRKRKGGF